MNNAQTVVRHGSQPARPASSARALGFSRDTAFQLALRRRVTEHFWATGRRERDCWQMYVKTAILLTGFAATYVSLVFLARTWIEGVPLAVLLGLLAAGIGLNIQHDGGHRAYSNRPWINRLMALTLELIGGSSYLWRWKHGVFHHTYVNVAGHDTDIELAPLARLAPNQKRLAIHRWQHLYMWPLYGLLSIKWQCLDDFRKIIQGRINFHRVPRPRGWELVIFVAGKVVFFTLAFGIPLQFHRLSVVLGYYVLSGTRHGVPAERGVPGGALRRGGRLPRARRDHRSHRPRLGCSPGRDEREFRPAQPHHVVARGRAELPDRAPSVPPDQPRPLPGDLGAGRADVPGVRDQVHRAPIVRGGDRLALPVAAPDG